MLLSILLQAIGGIGLTKLGAAIGAGIAVLGAGIGIGRIGGSMVIIFGIVFFILAKYAFPVITGMVDKRKQYIDSSLEAARQANEQLQQVKAESEALLARAHEEQTAILKEASATRDRIIAEARERARTEARKALDETRHQIAAEKESAINDIRRQVAILSVDVAEKVLRKKLSDDKEQLELVNRLLDEVKSNNDIE